LLNFGKKKQRGEACKERKTDDNSRGTGRRTGFSCKNDF